MKFSLHRLIGAIRSEDHILTGIKKLEKYGLEATSSLLPVRKITNMGGVLRMNGKATHLISNELSMGFTSALKDIYKIDSIPRSLELRTLDDIKFKPSFAVGENIRFVDNKFRPQLSSKLDNNAKKIMSSKRNIDQITPEVVERNPALKNIFSKMSGKTIRTVGGTLLTVGVGIAAVCAVVNEHRNRLTACMLYYYSDNQLKRCVINSCTCKQVACKQKCNYCPPDILTKYLPEDMIKDNCTNFSGSSACVNCPSENFNKGNILNDESLTSDNISEYCFVRCHSPDFFEALSDLFGGVSENLIDIVKESLNGISWIAQKLPYIIFAGIFGIIIAIIISIITKFGGKKTPPFTILREEDTNSI